jgi:hypothetical protein
MNQRRESPRDDSATSRREVVWPLLLLCLVVALFLGYWQYVDWLYPASDADNRGTFGDKFGGANALFSALAFAGVIYTVLLQRKELESQRAQIADARREQRRESFERTYFQLLQYLNESVRALHRKFKLQGEWKEYIGREAFWGFEQEFHLQLELDPQAPDDQLLISVRKATRDADLMGAEEIWPYLQNLYVLLLTLDGAEVENKELYVELLRAQFSYSQRLFILCYCLSDFGIGEFKRLVERHGILFIEGAYDDEQIVLIKNRLFDARAFQRAGAEPGVTAGGRN